MDLYFVTDARYHIGSDGKIYAGEMSFNHLLYKRYLANFDKVYIVGRLFENTDNIPKEHIVDNAEILPLPAFSNALEFIKKKGEVVKKLKDYLKRDGAVLIRGAGGVGYLASEICTKYQIPYGMEVIGDPYDAFAPGVIKHPLRIVLRNLFTYQQKKAVQNASATIYVTKFTLQNRYPTRKGVFQTHASNVFVNGKQDISAKVLSPKTAYSLVSIGALEQLYKAPDTCIKVIAEMKRQGFILNLKWLGVGKHMHEMKKLSEELGVASQVDFVGSVSRKEVDEYLDKSDIFLLLSRTEGLPRAMIEAMARALPCIGTNVGGIPELLDKAFLVPIDNVEIVCQKLQLLLQNPEIYYQQSVRNLETSQEYSAEILNQRREKFYETIKQIS